MSESQEPTPPIPDALSNVPDAPPEPLPVHPVRLEPEDPLPTSLGVVPLRSVVLFPGMVTPLVAVRPATLQVLRRAATVGTPVVFVAQRDGDNLDPDRDDLYDVGTAGRILRGLRFSDGTLRVLVQGLRRVRLGASAPHAATARARVSPIDEINPATSQSEILRRHLRDDFRHFGQQLGKTPQELEAVVNSMDLPGRLADYVAGNLPLKHAEHQAVLEPGGHGVEEGGQGPGPGPEVADEHALELSEGLLVERHDRDVVQGDPGLLQAGVDGLDGQPW